MKFYSLFLGLILLQTSHMIAQDQHCATDEIMKNYYMKHPDAKERRAQHDQDMLKRKASAVGSYTIPVVFHILHTGGPENISDAQVIDALAILNRDYARLNPDTVDIIPSMKALGDSSGIHFALATKDTNGNCTSGIIHYFDTNADWYDTSATLYSHSWNSSRYLNVYVVKRITMVGGFSAAGYTYFPGTWADGAPQDAIVLLNNYFGSIGTGNAFLSRVLTHEVGHWLDVYHVFGSSNGAGVDCSGDDFVGDTPQTIGYTICPDKNNPASYQTCTPGVDENFQNYMDYSYCCRMFTQGQIARMQAALQSSLSMRDNLVSTPNLIATGVINPVSPCVPIADFKYNRSETCVGTPVTFSDASWQGTPTTYTWSFPGGTPSSSNSANPSVTYSTTGLKSVSYTCANSAGTAAPVTKSNIINVVSGSTSYTSFYFEDFESSSLPNADWKVENSSGGALWDQSSDAAVSGTHCAKLPLVNNTRLAVSSMISPFISLTGHTTTSLLFSVAAAESNPNHINTLKVYISTDCKQTWTQIYSKTGSSLITTTNTTSPFIPLYNEWRNESVDITPFTGNAKINFKFSYIRDTIPGPNNIFIDAINISAPLGVDASTSESILKVFPNPSSGVVNVSFNLENSQHVKLNVSDVLGRVLETKANENLSSGNHTFVFGETEKLQKGIYFINFTVDGKQSSKKIIVE